jgi:hypothetical protein
MGDYNLKPAMIKKWMEGEGGKSNTEIGNKANR